MTTAVDLKVPTFLIIGAAKSGTTSLAQYLSQHPDIFLSQRKELKFFAYENSTFTGQDSVTDRQRYYKTMAKAIVNWDDYANHFQQAHPSQQIGEASPIYLYSNQAANRIHNYLPDVKIVAILRHPAERAFSHYLHKIRRGQRYDFVFEDQIKREDLSQIGNVWWGESHWVRMGFYAAQLDYYFAKFQPEQMLFLLFDDLKKHPNKVMVQLFDFLGVDPIQVETGQKFAQTGVPKNKRLDSLLFRPNRFRNNIKPILNRFLSPQTKSRIIQRYTKRYVDKPKLSADMRRQLTDLYRSDIQRLQSMIDRDLAHWL